MRLRKQFPFMRAEADGDTQSGSMGLTSSTAPDMSDCRYMDTRCQTNTRQSFAWGPEWNTVRGPARRGRRGSPPAPRAHNPLR